MTDQRCVYTCLFGDYEDLTEQPMSKDSAIDFVCITDNPRLRSETWRISVVARALPSDPQRSSRYPKICPHRFLDGYGLSMYIDNSVLLRQPPEIAFESFLAGGQPITVFAHSFRDTLEDEFHAVIAHGYEREQVCLEQMDIYRRTRPEALAMKPIIGGVLFRRHMQPAVMRAMETWWRHVLAYARRDQLSFLVALMESELIPSVANVDVRDNEYWTWPASTGRLRS